MKVTQTGVAANSKTATIANAASLSDAVDLQGEAIIGIIMPAAWTAAGLTFQASVDGSTFTNLYDYLGTEIAATVAVDRYIRLNPSDWVGMSHIKVRSGTSGAAVAQGAERLIKVITRAV